MDRTQLPPSSSGSPNFAQLQEIVLNAISMRFEAFQRFLDPRRNIDVECGFPKSGQTPSPYDYKDLYERNSTAARVVEVIPRETWQTQPEVKEDESSQVVTQFEQAWEDMGKGLRGNKSYFKGKEGNPVLEYLLRADRLSGRGSYGVILLGLDDQDNGDLAQPVGDIDLESGLPHDIAQAMKQSPVGGGYYNNTTQGVFGLNSEQLTLIGNDFPPPKPGKPPFPPPTNKATPKSQPPTGKFPPGKNQDTATENPQAQPADAADGTPEQTPEAWVPKYKLLFLRVFPEDLAQIVAVENDHRSPRFGLPTFYNITFNDPRETTTSAVMGMTTVSKRVHWSRVIHIADDLDSSEVFGVPRMRPVLRHLLSLEKLYGGSAEMYWRGAFPGFSFETHPQLGGQVDIDRTALKNEMEQYMNGLQRYLIAMGASIKPLAPQVVDPTPQISVQIEAICIKLGIPVRVFKGSERGELASSQDDSAWNDRLRARRDNYVTPRIIIPFVDRMIQLGVLPEPEDGYSVHWTNLDSLSDTEEAQIGQTRIATAAQYISGGVNAIIPEQEFLVRFMGMTEEEAQAMIADAKIATQQQQMEDMALQAKMIEQGLVADPTDPAQQPPQFGGPPQDQSQQFPPEE